MLDTLKLESKRRLTDSTVISRMMVLRQLNRFCTPDSFLDLGPIEIENYLDSRDLGARTRYAYTSHIHCFYEMLRRHGITEVNPTLKVLRPRLPRLVPRPGPTAELESAFKLASPKYRCWLALAAFGGFRVIEIARLRSEDVMLTERLIRARGKGGHERVVPMHPDVISSLKDLPMPGNGHVFLRPSGVPHTGSTMSHEFCEFLRGVGVDARPHQWRHWFATNLYTLTHDLRLTQEMLGHADVSTTAIYASFDRRGAAEAISKLCAAPAEEPVTSEQWQRRAEQAERKLERMGRALAK